MCAGACVRARVVVAGVQPPKSLHYLDCKLFIIYIVETQVCRSFYKSSVYKMPSFVQWFGRFALVLSLSAAVRAAGENDGQQIPVSGTTLNINSGLNYYIMHQQGQVSSTGESYFDLAKENLKRQAVSSDEEGGGTAKWQSMFLLGDLLQRSKKVSLD